MKVLITGGSGLIGSQLTQKLKQENVEVVHLTRYPNSKNGVKTYKWDYKSGNIDERCFDGVTHIVHLAGEGIADKPWTTERKRNIVKSRVLTARLLETKVKALKLPLEAFISASGIGYYGAITSDKIFEENDTRGTDFVAECCDQWENAADQFQPLCRVVKLRMGVVLSKKGGIVEKMGNPIKKGLGSPLGKGTQFMPWIHIDDMVAIYYEALTNTAISGVYNAVSTEHITNTYFTHELAKVLHKKIRLPNAPSWVIKLVFGEMAAILLEGPRVSNEKIKKEGFVFQYDNFTTALENL